MFAYQCEKCGQEVPLTQAEHDTLAQAQRKQRINGSKYGTRVVCDPCNGTVPNPEPSPDLKARAKPKPYFTFVPGETLGLSLTPKERKDYGVTLTIREQETRKVHTFAVKGPLIASLTQACEMIDAIPEGNWKIVCISNPISIFRDLQGAYNTETVSPEMNRLSRVGRADLLEELPYGVTGET